MSTIPISLAEKQFDEHIRPYITVTKRGYECKIPLHKVFNYILYQRHTGCQWYRLPIDLDRKDRATGCFQRPPSLETTESSSSIHHGMYIFRRCAWC